MIIPKLHYISQGSSPNEHLENIQKACTSGIELVQLGLENVSEKKFLKVAQKAREITAHYQTRLIIPEQYKIAMAVKADGVHLEGTDFSHAQIRKELYSWQSMSGSAYNLQDCEELLHKGVDYIHLGPFRAPLAQNNEIIALGLDGYMLIMEELKTETPVIGRGGIRTADVKKIVETGVSGIAVSDVITADFDSIRLFNQLLNASATAEQRHTFE